jgi:predicted CopG family antitoxin
MATRTVSLKTEAYERLKAARRYPSESFSEVVLRARWPEETITGGELLRRYRTHGPFFSKTELDEIEAAKAAMNRPPEDKWHEA